MMRIDLNGQWDGSRITDGLHFKGSVPGSVMNDLLINDLAEDPFYRDNEYRAYEFFRHDYSYKSNFTLNEGIPESDSVELVCEGLDTLSEIYINNMQVGSTDNMHRTYRLDIREYIKPGENSINIIFRSPVEFIENAWDEKDPIWGVCAKDGYQFIRKAHYMYGWDWGPAIPDCGIWRDIYIEYKNKASLNDVYIRQEHTGDTVTLKFEADITNFSNAETGLRITIRNSVGIPVGSTLCSQGRGSLKIENPELWWPAGYGEQPLYTVLAELMDDGNVIDSIEYRIGLRRLSVRMEDDEWGQSFSYNINGIDIFAKGANYIPEDNILARCSEAKTRKLLGHAAAANFNSIRVWGGGIYPESYFFDICDELGLVVWQDFMFACAQYCLDDGNFVDSIKEEIKDNIRRLRHHASIALWCGNNEMEWLWMDEQTKDRSREQMDEYLELFEGIIPPIVSAEDPDRLYWPASPSSGGGFDKPNDENRGDVHYWDVWHGLKPFTEYRKFYFRFCSEFGFQSFPCLRTVESYTLPEDRNIFSYVMESHQKNAGANGKILYYLSENFKNPKDFESLLYVSQLLQAEAIKYGVEHWRRNRGRCMGSIYWQFNDCWPVASWSSIDSFHRWKALHYFAKRFYAPVLASAEDDGCRVSLHISNESRKKSRGVLEWELIYNSGEVIRAGEEKVSVPALSGSEIFSLDFTEELKDMDKRRKTLLFYEYRDGSGNISGSTLLFVPNKYFLYEQPRISVEYRKNGSGLDIELNTDSYAGYVKLESADCDCVFSDNFFNLVPGKTMTVSVLPEINHDDFIKGLGIISIHDTF